MVTVSAEQVNPSFGRNDIKRRPTPSYRNTPLERRRPATTTKELERQEGSHANFERLSELFQGRRYRRRQSESSASGFTNSFSGKHRHRKMIESNNMAIAISFIILLQPSKTLQKNYIGRNRVSQMN